METPDGKGESEGMKRHHDGHPRWVWDEPTVKGMEGSPMSEDLTITDEPIVKGMEGEFTGWFTERHIPGVDDLPHPTSRRVTLSWNADYSLTFAWGDEGETLTIDKEEMTPLWLMVGEWWERDTPQ